jgi:hypothetical protein
MILRGLVEVAIPGQIDTALTRPFTPNTTIPDSVPGSERHPQ